MSGTRSSEERQEFYVKTMGAELGPLYAALWNEVAWVFAKWQEFEELYGTNQSRIELMNNSAGGFFRLVQDAMLEDVLLHIARLTDPPNSGGNKENLTILQLPGVIDQLDTKKSLECLIEVAKNDAHFCRDWRNRRIAHRDLALALKKGTEPLEPVNRINVKRALTSISDVMNKVSTSYADAESSFEGVGRFTGALSLLCVLDDGLRAAAERDKRITSGNPLPTDLQKREL